MHIADVSWFINEGSVLDRVASLRATSVYLVHKVCVSCVSQENYKKSFSDIENSRACLVLTIMTGQNKFHHMTSRQGVK